MDDPYREPAPQPPEEENPVETARRIRRVFRILCAAAAFSIAVNILVAIIRARYR